MLNYRIYEVVKFGNKSVRFYDSFAYALRKAQTLSSDPNVYVEIWQHYDYIDNCLVKLASPRLILNFN